MRKCVWSATAVAVFALSGLYLAAQHAARHPDSNLGCFLHGLVAWVPGCGGETQPVINAPYASRVESKPAPTACPVEPNEPIVVERSKFEDQLLNSQFYSGPPGGATSELGEHLTPARVDGIISPSGGAEESDEPPPFMPLCPEDEPDGVRRMPYAEDEDDESTAAIKDILIQVQEISGGILGNLRTIMDAAEESESDMFRCPEDRYHPHPPSCPYTGGGRCPVPTYRVVTPMPPAMKK